MTHDREAMLSGPEELAAAVRTLYVAAMNVRTALPHDFRRRDLENALVVVRPLLHDLEEVQARVVGIEAEPVRSCCGERHAGAVCPDGKDVCCLCFERVEIEELNVVEGRYEDVCKACAAMEPIAEELHDRR